MTKFVSISFSAHAQAAIHNLGVLRHRVSECYHRYLICSERYQTNGIRAEAPPFDTTNSVPQKIWRLILWLVVLEVYGRVAVETDAEQQQQKKTMKSRKFTCRFGSAGFCCLLFLPQFQNIIVERLSKALSIRSSMQSLMKLLSVSLGVFCPSKRTAYSHLGIDKLAFNCWIAVYWWQNNLRIRFLKPSENTWMRSWEWCWQRH